MRFHFVAALAAHLALAPALVAQCDPPTAGPGPGPASPGPGFPLAPGTGPTGPGGPGRPTVTGGGTAAAIGDEAHWSTWWLLHREHYLDLRAHVRDDGPVSGTESFYLGRGQTDDVRRASLGPGPDQLATDVLPAVLTLLAKDPPAQIAGGALLTAAKTARALDTLTRANTAAVLREYLAHANRPVAEAAVIALGLLAHEMEAPRLASLLHDEAAGRELLGKRRGEVPLRMRAMAAYALGLLGRHTSREDVRRYCVHHLARALEEDLSATRDAEVACVLAIGWIPLADGGAVVSDDGGDVPPSASRDGQLALLAGILSGDFQHRLPRANAATAFAQLLADLPEERRDAWKERVVPDMLRAIDSKAREPREVVQSVVLALGELGDADDDPLDARIRRALRAVPEDLSDRLARNASLVALARIATRPGREPLPSAATTTIERHLLQHLARGRTDARAWAGLALGVLGRGLEREQVNVSADTRNALRAAFATASSPTDEAAYALALGLCRDHTSVDALIENLGGSDPFLRGRSAVALGLAGDTRAIEPLRELLRESTSRPELLLAASEALALLADKSVVPELTAMLARAGAMASRATAAGCLGRVGDARAVEPLLKTATRANQTDAARAAALAGLGHVVAPDPLPWKAPLSLALNLQAAPATLIDATGAGLLNRP